MRSLLVVLVAAVACCGPTSASPSRQRRSLLTGGLPLPEGVPLAVLFEACGDGFGEVDLGPCVEQLLQGAIELSRPAFATGIEVGGKTIVLEPLKLKDIEPKKNRPKKKARISGRNIMVSGISSLSVDDVTLLPDRLALTLNFTQLRASGDLTVSFSIFRASPQVVLTLNNVSLQVETNWELGVVDGKLGISFSNVSVGVDIGSFSTDIEGLSGLGRFVESFLNRNNQLLLDVFEPKLEEKAKRLLEKEFQTIKLGRLL